MLHTLAPDLGAETAAKVVETLSRELGGQAVYLPKRSPWFDRCARDLAIKRAYNGKNMRRVCEEYNVSRTTVYRACRKSTAFS